MDMLGGNMADKKGVFLFIVLILIALAIGQQKITFPSKLLFSVVDFESQLKQEYNTIWADATDGMVDESTCAFSGSESVYTQKVAEIQSNGKGCVYYKSTYYEDNNFIVTSNAFFKTRDVDGGIIDLTGSGQDSSSQITLKKKFIGQEIALIVGGAFHSNIGISGTGTKNIILKPHTLEPTRWDVIIDGSKVKEVTSDSSGLTIVFSTESGIYGRVIIYYVGYKAQFECDLSQDEVFIQEVFDANQPISVNDIVFVPTKYCKTTRPFLLRDIQLGETPISPDPIPDFNRGKSIIACGGLIPPNFCGTGGQDIIIINYATYYVSGVTNRCGVNQANIKDSSGRWVCQDVIKPENIIVGCKVDADCYIPTKPQCFGYFLGCQNNKCSYDENIPDSPICKNEVVTIVKQIQEVDKRAIVPITGINIFTFSQNKDRSSGFNFGDSFFTASIPQFMCSSSNDIVSAPNPSSDCWQTTINFEGTSHTIKDTQKISLSPVIDVQYFASGTYVINPEFKQANDKTKFRNDDWGNTFIFTINTENAMQFSIEDSAFVIKDSAKKIRIALVNNLPNGELIIKSQQRIKSTNQNLPEAITSHKIVSGANNIEININTSNLGINIMAIQAFYKMKVDSKVLIPSDKIILNYDVVAELPSIEKIVEIEKEKVVLEPSERQTYFSTIPIWVRAVGGIVIALFLLWRLL